MRKCGVPRSAVPAWGLPGLMAGAGLCGAASMTGGVWPEGRHLVKYPHLLERPGREVGCALSSHPCLGFSKADGRGGTFHVPNFHNVLH